MKINSKKYLLRDIYYYDLVSCHLNILKKLNYDIEDLSKLDKLQRNIQIGLLQKNNPNMTNMLRGITKSIIDQYILINDLKEENIICRQYDGIITNIKLNKTDVLEFEFPLRHKFELFLIPYTKDGYIAKSGDYYEIKGISNRYDKMDYYFKKLININFASKIATFKELQKIKNEILDGNDIRLFIIPHDNETCSIILKEYGIINTSITTTNIIDISEIDRYGYFEKYIVPFSRSIVMELC